LGKQVAIFEVKTGTDRQQLYTAIGQLEVHSKNAPASRRYLVIPERGVVAKEIGECVKKRGIHVFRFKLLKRSVKITGAKVA
jgi:hypothetical protein